MDDRRRTLVLAILTAGLLLLATAPLQAQTASALLREGDPLPGAPGENVSSINNPVVNHIGGYGLTVNTSGSGTTLGHIWGNATGGAGTVILTEGTYGVYQQTSLESFHGLSDAGVPGYSAIATHTGTGTTGLDGAWLGTMSVLVEEEPVPTLPGQFSTFNSRVAITADGIPYWVGGISAIQGGSSQNRVLFYGTGATVILMGGDPIPGVAEPIDTGSSNIDFDYRFSALGTHYLAPVRLDASSTIDGLLVLDGAPLMPGGSIAREGSPVPAAIGGLPGESWDNFDNLGITEAGDYLVTGDTDAATAMDEFVMVSGQIVLREGDMIDSAAGMVPISGSIEGGYMNENGDWAVIWDVDDPVDGNVEALIFNGSVVLAEGDAVDLDGDGVEEPNSILANFTGIASLVVGDSNAQGLVDIYFTADIDTMGTSSSSDDTEGMFRLTVQSGDVFVLELPLDIKPGSCPNSYNPVRNGKLPVSIPGSMDFDVFSIDVSTLTISRGDGVGGSVAAIEGPPGPHTVVEDTATPFIGEGVCDCAGVTGDGILDLSMKFDSIEMREALALDDLGVDTMLELVVSGTLLDGTLFEASDCVRIVGGPPPALSGATEDSDKSSPVTYYALETVGDGGRESGNSIGGTDDELLTRLSMRGNPATRLRILRTLIGRADPSLQPLLERYLEDLLADSGSAGDRDSRLGARELLNQLRRDR